MALSFCPKFYKLPITALTFYSDLILAGSGGNVKIYDTSDNNTFIKEFTIFKNSVIHAIKVFKENDGNILIIFGAREICILDLNIEGKIYFKVKNHFSCHDWILDAVSLLSESKRLVAVALAHNSVVLYDENDTTKLLREIHCVEKCILYSAHFININNEFTLDNLLLCGGTVFNQVVIWKPQFKKEPTNERVCVMTRLYGHDGVIFNISFHHQTNLLLSASDDRSTRVWDYDITSTNNGTCDCSCVLYGHEARVWKVDSFKKDNDKFVASVAEDGFLILWKLLETNNHQYASSIIRKLNCGGNLLSLCLKNSTDISVGGSDGSVRLFKITNILNPSKIFVPEKLPDQYGVLKTIKLLLSNQLSVLFHTDIGTLGLYNIVNRKWTILQENKKYGSYASMSINKNEDLVAIGNTKGDVQVILLGQGHDISSNIEFSDFNGKVLNVTWFKNNLFLSGPEGKLIWYLITYNNQDLSLHPQATFVLPHAKHRWHTDVLLTFIDGVEYLVCGDRRGSIHLFKRDTCEPVHTLHGLHGKNGVTTLQQHQHIFTSTGRDGFWRQYLVRGNRLCLLSKNRSMQGMDWLEGLSIAKNNRMYIHGFHGNKFVLWSKHSGDELFSVLCGGCHRSWGFSAQFSMFVFLKAGQLNICQIPYDVMSESLLDSGLHTQQTNCIKYLGSTVKGGDSDAVVVATAGEDTKVIISVIWHSNSKSQLEVLRVLSDHSSNIRNISVLHLSLDSGLTDILMCTIGSKATLNVYHISYDSDLISQNRCMVEHLASYSNSVKDKSDIRFMDVTMWKNKGNNSHMMAIACSDGTISCIQLQNQSLKEIYKSKEYHHCFLTISRFDNLLLCGSTNGNIYFMTRALEEISSVKCHQSGINAIAVNRIVGDGQNHGVVATGGDDNSIHITVFSSEDEVLKVRGKLAIENAHLAQITGIDLRRNGRDFILTSTGIDQRLTRWDVEIKMTDKTAEIKCERKWSEVTQIADASGLEVVDARLLIGGRGILYGIAAD